MSLIPFLLNGPSHIIDQHFGHGLDMDDTFIAMTPIHHPHYTRHWRYMAKSASRMDSGSKIVADKDKYQVCLDVQQFAPNEISVKIVGREIVVEGKHEEKEDEHGFISRHFIRIYILPEDYKAEDTSASLTSDGILSVTAPRKALPAAESEKVVTITQIGPANKSVQKQGKNDAPGDGTVIQ